MPRLQKVEMPEITVLDEPRNMAVRVLYEATTQIEALELDAA